MARPLTHRERIPAVLRTARAALLAAVVLSGCAVRSPILVPPSGGAGSVEGYGTADLRGAVAGEGKFAFVFRRPGLGRVEGVDPLGRTAFVLLFEKDRAWFAVPSRKTYAEDPAEEMMARFIGGRLRPDDVLRLLGGGWDGSEAAEGWTVDRDEQGRVVAGHRGEFSFLVRTHFRGGGVPREVLITGPEASGRVRVLRLTFDPPPRAEAFDRAFLQAFTRKSWPELEEMLRR